jgi:hypothetical protein
MGQLQLYEIQQQQQQINFKLIQTFSKKHPSGYSITSLIQINPDTLVSASDSSDSSSIFSAIFSSNVIVIWSKSKSSLLYEPLQRITFKEVGGGINDLVLINQKKEEEEEFASCSRGDNSIIIWRRVKGDKEIFKIKQKIENVEDVSELLYIPLTNELIFASDSYPYLLQIWSPSSSSSSDFVERQKMETSYASIWSLCQINNNDTKSRRIEFASGHNRGQVMIWSKQINESNHYSSIRTLKPFAYNAVVDLIFINDKGFDLLVACCDDENKIVIYKGEGEEGEELEHEGVWRLIPMSNGQFASGGGYDNQCLNIWPSPSSSSSP